MFAPLVRPAAFLKLLALRALLTLLRLSGLISRPFAKWLIGVEILPYKLACIIKPLITGAYFPGEGPRGHSS